MPVYLPVTVLALHSFIGLDPWMHGIIYLLVKIINLHCFELAFRIFKIEVHYCLVPAIDFDFLNLHIKCAIEKWMLSYLFFFLVIEYASA